MNCFLNLFPDIDAFGTEIIKQCLFLLQADPYLVVELGKQKINDREKYVPNSLNPLFGRYLKYILHMIALKYLIAILYTELLIYHVAEFPI